MARSATAPNAERFATDPGPASAVKPREAGRSALSSLVSPGTGSDPDADSQVRLLGARFRRRRSHLEERLESPDRRSNVITQGEEGDNFYIVDEAAAPAVRRKPVAIPSFAGAMP